MGSRIALGCSLLAVAIILLSRLAQWDLARKARDQVQASLTHSLIVITPAPAPKVANPYPGKPIDKGWVLQGITWKTDAAGNWGGTARITNVNPTEMTASFTFTLSQNGAQVGTMIGNALQTSPGQTVTVDLVSQDTALPGLVHYEFQTTATY